MKPPIRFSIPKALPQLQYFEDLKGPILSKTGLSMKDVLDYSSYFINDFQITGPEDIHTTNKRLHHV